VKAAARIAIKNNGVIFMGAHFTRAPSQHKPGFSVACIQIVPPLE
jgi:hypothetical protein